jgi:hypothetical protein
VEGLHLLPPESLCGIGDPAPTGLGLYKLSRPKL